MIADLGSGGAQRVATLLASHWMAQGRTVHVITFSGRDGDFFDLPRGAKRIALDMLGRSGSLWQGLAANLGRLRKLRRALRNTGEGTIVSFVGVTNIMTVLAAAGLGRRVIISERNDPARQALGFPWTQLRRWVYPRAGLVTANSENAIAALWVYVPRARLRLVRNPVALPDSPVDAEREKLILAVGRLTAQKAFDILLDAFADVHRSHPGWRLGIAGEGEQGDTLKRQAAELGIEGAVDWYGRVDDPAALYRRAAAFALPSRHEGMPNALLEAMSWGLATVVSDASGGALEHVRDGETGLVVPVEDAGALAAVLSRLIDEDGLRKAMGRAARACMELQSAETVFAEWDGIVDGRGADGEGAA